MTRRVLVTRPEPGASATARRLLELGFEPVVLPLTRIVAVALDRMPDAAAFDAVAVTSANAIRHAPKALLRLLAGKPLFAVGERSADLARREEFVDVRAAASDAGDLALRLRSALPAAARVLYLAGAVRIDGFKQALGDLEVETVVVYDAEAIDRQSDAISAALGDRDIWGALVYSARGAALLSDLVGGASLAPLFEDATFFCISANAAAALQGIDGNRIRIAGQPDETGIFALLQG